MKPFFRKACMALALFASASAMAAAPEQVSLSDLHMETTGNGLSAITGNAHNDTNATLKTVFVKFNLYKEGTIIGEAIDAGENIGPGENWELHAMINTFKDKPDSFKVTEIEVVN